MQKKVFSYNRIYGGFAALPLFLVWLNWSWQIVLFGAEVSFVSQNISGGVFENGREKERTLRLCREHQLAVLRRIFRHFIDGKGALTERELLSYLHLPETMMRNEISELLEKNIICRTRTVHDELAFLPGVSPENYTILNFLQTIHGKGDTETVEFEAFERCFASIEKSIGESPLNLRIIDIK